MDIAEIYFAFHRRATFREMITGQTEWAMAFGHVEAFGYTIDDTWFFFDPGRSLTKLKITHLHGEVETLMGEKFAAAKEVIRFNGEPGSFRAPIHGPMNCVTQCAGLIGMRAFTPKGFRRSLIAIGAEVIHGPEKQ